MWKIFSMTIMLSISKGNRNHRHHGLHVAESNLMGGLLEGGEDERQVLAADYSHRHSLHLYL